MRLDSVHVLHTCLCFVITLFSNVFSLRWKPNLNKLCVQAGEGQVEENGLLISNAFSLNPDTPSGRPTASFNPGRGSGPMGQLVQNGDTGTHNRAGDEFITGSIEVKCYISDLKWSMTSGLLHCYKVCSLEELHKMFMQCFMSVSRLHVCVLFSYISHFVCRNLHGASSDTVSLYLSLFPSWLC